MARRSPTARGLRSAVMSVACLLPRNAAAGFRRSRRISVASAARRECVTEDFGHHNDSRVQTGFGERGGAGERSEHHRVRHHQRQVVVPVEMTGTSTAVVIAPMRAATLAFRFGARTTSGNNRSVFSRKRHFLNRLGLTLVLSPHNPPTQLPQRNPTPPSPLLLSCIRILLPGGDRTVPSRGRVGGRLGRRRPSLRLTRIHLPPTPAPGIRPPSARAAQHPPQTTAHPQHHASEARQCAADPARPPNPAPVPSPPALRHAPARPHRPPVRTDHPAMLDAA